MSLGGEARMRHTRTSVIITSALIREYEQFGDA